MTKSQTKLWRALPLIALLAACQTTGDNYRADVYTSGQVNQAQEVKTVKIIAIMPARVEVDNSEAKKRAQIGAGLIGVLAGGVLGAQSNNNSKDNALIGGAAGGAAGVAAGSMVSDKALVNGVAITYTYQGKTFNSAQVGRQCEYKTGTAIMVSQENDETRIQPNTTCPEGDA